MKIKKFYFAIIFCFFFPYKGFSDKISNGYFYYTIKTGNTLSFITEYFGISKEILSQYNSAKFLNQFPKNGILKIPLKRSIISSYTIEKGDTIFSLEKKMNLNSNTLSQILDDETKNNFWKGKIIYLPNRSGKKITTSSKKEIVSSTLTKSPSALPFLIYSVKKGDSFYGIANKLDIPVEMLQKLYKKQTLIYNTDIRIPSSLIKNKSLFDSYHQSELKNPSKNKEKVVREVPSANSLEKVPKEFVLKPINKGSLNIYSSLSQGKVFLNNIDSPQPLFAPLTGKIIENKPFFSFGTAIFFETKKGVFIFASKGFQALSVNKNKLVTRGTKLTFVKPKNRVFVFLINLKGDVQTPW